MKRVVLFLAAIAMIVPLAHAEELFPQLSCTVVEGDCGAGDVCWLSMSGKTNAHVGYCDEYDYNLCCTRTVSAEVKAACAPTEQPVLAISQITNNAHAEEYFSFYNNYVCITPTGNTNFEYARVESRSSPPEGAVCIIGLSNRTNAHVGDCMEDPYQLGLYVRTRITIPGELNNSIQVNLKVLSTNDLVYVPGFGEKNYSATNAQVYAGVPYFAAITQGNQVLGIISDPDASTLNKSIEKGGGYYSMKIDQSRGSNDVRIFFTKGPESLPIERATDFLSGTAIESFGYELSEEQLAMVGLSYDKLTFRNSKILRPGEYQLKLEHLGTRDKKIVMKVDIVE